MKLSRSALEQFIRCPRCYYQRRRLGLKPPSIVPLTLAVAVDALLKNEFDAVREDGSNHPLWLRECLNVRAFRHTDIEDWRSNVKGIRCCHPSGAEIYGAIDDVWEDLSTGELHVVDYKSTSKRGEPSIEDGWGDSYKRQMEIYQWLFRKAGFKVSSIGYFLYVNGSKDGTFFDSAPEGRLQFKATLIPYEGNDNWVDSTINDAVLCLHSDRVPDSGADCDICRFFRTRLEIETHLKVVNTPDLS